MVYSASLLMIDIEEQAVREGLQEPSDDMLEIGVWLHDYCGYQIGWQPVQDICKSDSRIVVLQQDAARKYSTDDTSFQTSSSS